VTPSEKYVAAAYVVVFLALLAWVLIISTKIQRLERDVADILQRVRERTVEDG
jgi:hypothetical protein